MINEIIMTLVVVMITWRTSYSCDDNNLIILF